MMSWKHRGRIVEEREEQRVMLEASRNVSTTSAKSTGTTFSRANDDMCHTGREERANERERR
jgi:hypothetical protein